MPPAGQLGIQFLRGKTLQLADEYAKRYIGQLRLRVSQDFEPLCVDAKDAQCR